MVDVAVGRSVAGHRLLERIGGGHYGEVWKAEYMGHTVALKIFAGARRRASLRREAFAQYALGRLSGPDARHFPLVEHIELEADPPYMRMEFVEGRPLEDLLASPSLSLDQRMAIASRVLEAVAAVHRHGFVHGDLSPLNVLVTPDHKVKLIDVGYGALFDEEAADLAVSHEGEAHPAGVASPLYAAPERFRAEVGKPADVFSFGKILYRLVTGEAPFVIKPVSLKFPALGAAWDDYLFRCLEEDPAKRFADGEAALEAFAKVHRPEPVGGEFRAECPECRARMAVPGGWAGERFACQSCGVTVEVLFYDEATRHASTALVSAPAAPGRPEIEFVEEPKPDVVILEGVRARKFCPACGQSIYAEARKCRHCNAWADDVARRVTRAEGARRARLQAAPVPERSFRLAAAATLVAYALFWIPGALLNWYFLEEARRQRRQTGRPPAGASALTAMIWIFVYLPLVAMGTALLVGLAAVAIGGAAGR